MPGGFYPGVARRAKIRSETVTSQKSMPIARGQRALDGAAFAGLCICL